MSNTEELTYALSYSAEFEASVIGAICIEPRAVDRIAGTVDAEDFLSPIYGEVFRAALKSRDMGKAFDPVLAADAIRELTPDSEGIIRQCMEKCPSVTNAEYHGELVHSAAQERRLREGIRNILETRHGNEIAVELAGLCQDFMLGKLGSVHSMAEIMQNLADTLTSPPQNRLDTGFPRLDGIMKGMRGGNLILIAARPSVGKSAFAQDIAETVARQGKKVLFYSLEMSDEELGERWLSRSSGVPLDNITDHKMGKEEWKTATDAFQYLSGLPILVCDDPALTVERIRAQARTTPNVALIVVDFLTLMKSGQQEQNRNLEIGAISRNLKLLAMELKIPIIALSQLNRNVSDTDKPGLSALRDSGELEQNANKVIFLWNIDREEGIKGVSVAKNRQGKCGEVQMRFDGDRMKFTEMSVNVPDTNRPTGRGRRKRPVYDDEDQF